MRLRGPVKASQRMENEGGAIINKSNFDPSLKIFLVISITTQIFHLPRFLPLINHEFPMGTPVKFNLYRLPVKEDVRFQGGTADLAMT